MRYELTDFEWAAIPALLPNKPRGIRLIEGPARKFSEFGSFLIGFSSACFTSTL